MDDRSLTFRYKDYRGHRARSLTLPLQEFVRRFLLHVLPKGFVRIRYYGGLAHGSRARWLSCCQRALGCVQPAPEPDAQHPQDDAILPDLLPTGLRRCPHCKEGVLRCVQLLGRPPPAQPYRRVAA